LLKSLVYCTIPKEGTSQEIKKQDNQKKVECLDVVLGIDQTPVIPKKALFLEKDFDPFDPYSKYNEQEYLNGLDFTRIDMQMSNMSI